MSKKPVGSEEKDHISFKVLRSLKERIRHAAFQSGVSKSVYIASVLDAHVPAIARLTKR